MKRVFITGATGFIGWNVIEPLITKDWDIHAASTRPVVGVRGVTWHQVNLFDYDGLARLIESIKPSHLLHLAWYVQPGRFWSAPENIDWTAASLHLFRSFEKYGGERIVVAGTCAEYDWQSGRCVEDVTTMLPSTLYGRCKLALYELLSGYSQMVDLSFAWGRVFNIYGPREYRNRLVPAVITSLLRGEAARCSEGDQLRDFLHVADVAGAFVALLENNITGAVNIASGQDTSVKDVALKIAELIGGRGTIEFGSLEASDQPRAIVADCSRLRHNFGWKPMYTLESGLRQTIEWWKQQL